MSHNLLPPVSPEETVLSDDDSPLLSDEEAATAASSKPLTAAEIALNGRICTFLTITGLKDKYLAQAIGMSKGVVYLIKHNKQAASAKFLMAMLRVYTDLRADWLMRNEGSMFLSDSLTAEEPSPAYLLSATTQLENQQALIEMYQKQLKEAEIKVAFYKQKSEGK